MSSENLILCESALPAEDGGGLEPLKERRDEGYRSAFVQTKRAVGVELGRERPFSLIWRQLLTDRSDSRLKAFTLQPSLSTLSLLSSGSRKK